MLSLFTFSPSERRGIEVSHCSMVRLRTQSVKGRGVRAPLSGTPLGEIVQRKTTFMASACVIERGTESIYPTIGASLAPARPGAISTNTFQQAGY
jgi:hypothetical protein